MSEESLVRSARAVTLLVTVCLLAAARVSGQSKGLEIGLVRSASVATGGPLSLVQTVRFHSVEVVVSTPLIRDEWWSLDFVGAVLPYAWATETALGPAGIAPGLASWQVSRTAGRATSRGYGFRPLGLRSVVGDGDISLQLHVAGGFLRFSLPTPAANATRFNFTGEVGGGLRAKTRWGHVGAGYRFHHLSNAGLGVVNPGVDSHQIYLGVWLR